MVIFARVEIAGPGFINLVISPSAWFQILDEIHRLDHNYGRSNLGHGRYVQVEFVSANPTGPLHVGHGRGAAVGDALASILEATGHRVEREYYINDAGDSDRDARALGLFAIPATPRPSGGLSRNLLPR